MKKVMVLSILTISLATSAVYAKEDIGAWTMFNHGANSPKGKLPKHEADSNDAWTMFNTGTRLWNKGGHILPAQTNGLQVRIVKTKTVKSYN